MEVLIIGTGFGIYAMAPAYARLGMATRVVSPRDDAAVAREIAAGAQLVSIHSPPFLHHRHVMLALDRGLPVLCDKPFGATLAEARAMRDRAQALGLPNFVNFELRWQPARIAAKRLIDTGAIGSLMHVHWSMFGNGLRAKRHGWLFEAERAGGWIGAYGAHAIDAMRWWTGSEVARCGGMTRVEVPIRPDIAGTPRACTAEDAFSVWAIMDSGTTLAFDTAFCGPVNVPERVILFGSDAALEITADRELTLRRPGRPDEAVALPAMGPDGYAAALDPWLAAIRDAVRGGPAVTPDFSDGVATTQVLEALRAAVARA